MEICLRGKMGLRSAGEGRSAVRTGDIAEPNMAALCGPRTAIAHVAAQPGDQLLDHLFVGRTELLLLGRCRLRPSFDAALGINLGKRLGEQREAEAEGRYRQYRQLL
jgi:hypothetical protein